MSQPQLCALLPSTITYAFSPRQEKGVLVLVLSHSLLTRLGRCGIAAQVCFGKLDKAKKEFCTLQVIPIYEIRFLLETKAEQETSLPQLVWAFTQQAEFLQSVPRRYAHSNLELAEIDVESLSLQQEKQLTIARAEVEFNQVAGSKEYQFAIICYPQEQTINTIRSNGWDKSTLYAWDNRLYRWEEEHA